MAEQVLPFYLVCDESASMACNIELLNNDLLPSLHEEIGEDPIVSDKTQLGIIGFAEDARVLLPLSDLSDLTCIPGLVARGMTNYGAAFRLLRVTVDEDVRRLKGEGSQVYRPAVFFISDGQPTDSGWREGLGRVTDRTWKFRPNIIAFGFEDGSDGKVIREVGSFRAFTLDGSITPGAALSEFARALTKSIVRSGQRTSTSGMTLEVPDRIEGFTPLTLDPL